MNYLIRLRFLYLLLMAYCLALPLVVVQAQDPHFSQFNTSPLNLNPAFTGATLEGRFAFNYRAQWTKIPGEFFTYQAAYDHNLREYNSGVGVLAQIDQAGSGGFRSTNVQLLYAYDLNFGDFAVKAGLSLGYGNRSLNYYQLVFGDQLADNGSGFTGTVSNDPTIRDANVDYLDASAGLLFYGENFWLGVSALHLNQPNQGFVSGIEERLPMRIALQGGLKFTQYRRLNSVHADYDMALMPGFYYSQQGDFRQLDLGFNAYLSPIIVGLWYRGVPIQASYNGALVMMGGFRYKSLAFLYSYDATVGKLAGLIGGAHEISLSIKIGNLETKRKFRRKGKKVVFPSMVY